MSSNEVVCDFLDDAGIIPVPYPDEFAIEASEQVASTIEPIIRHQDRSQANEETEVLASSRDGGEQSPGKNIFSPGSRLLSPTPSSSYRSNYRAATPTYRRPSLSTFSSQPSTPRSNEPPLFSVNGEQSEYRRLLNNVIAAAKSKRGGFPTRGAFNLDGLFNALSISSDTDPASYDSPFGVRSKNQLDHDMKIGAAGELYVRSKPILLTLLLIQP
jgi:hypothetical protein